MDNSNKKTGRPTKPYRTSWGENIDGLNRMTDGRWRIVATGQRFSEADERLAVAKFRQQQRDGAATVEVNVPSTDMPNQSAMLAAMDNGASLLGYADGTKELSIGVSENVIWPWLRSLLLNKPQYVADKVGIPQLATLADWQLPKASIKLADLWRAYSEHASAKQISKDKAKASWDEFVELTEADTLRQLTVEKFLAYADAIKCKGLAASYVANKFERVKRIIKFGLQRGMNEADITGALNRAKVLVAPEGRQTYTAHPIERVDYHKLLAKADGLETAALLLSLNCCMYAAEVLDVCWEDIDMAAGTLVMARGKTNMIRAGVLWERTITALRALPKMTATGHIFRSSRGTAYHPNSFRKIFSDLRKTAGVDKAVEYNQIRDGAYTAVCNAGVTFEYAEILAGHKSSAGQSDKYIRRNPKMVAPACTAIEVAYFG